MRRSGTVAETNPERSMVGIKTEDGFTIIELLVEWDLDIGDRVAWSSGYGLGSETYENLTKRTRGRVCVQNHSVSAGGLRVKLLL